MRGEAERSHRNVRGCWQSKPRGLDRRTVRSQIEDPSWLGKSVRFIAIARLEGSFASFRK